MSETSACDYCRGSSLLVKSLRLLSLLGALLVALGTLAALLGTLFGALATLHGVPVIAVVFHSVAHPIISIAVIAVIGARHCVRRLGLCQKLS